MPPGFPRDQLKQRYDVPLIREDEWHSYSGSMTTRVLKRELGPLSNAALLLNAGAGIYSIEWESECQISLDLFGAPLQGRRHAVCGSVEVLPFRSEVFDAVVCVGEVLACGPSGEIEVTTTR